MNCHKIITIKIVRLISKKHFFLNYRNVHLQEGSQGKDTQGKDNYMEIAVTWYLHYC